MAETKPVAPTLVDWEEVKALIGSLSQEVKELRDEKERKSPPISPRWVIKNQIAVCPGCEGSIERVGTSNIYRCDNACACDYTVNDKNRMVKVEVPISPAGKSKTA